MFDIFCGFCFRTNPLIDGIGSQQLISVGRVLSSSDLWADEKREKVNFAPNRANWMRRNDDHRSSANKCLPMRRLAMGSGPGSLSFTRERLGQRHQRLKCQKSWRRWIVWIAHNKWLTKEEIFFGCLLSQFKAVLVMWFLLVSSYSLNIIISKRNFRRLTSHSHVTILINFRFTAKQKENMQLWIR